MTACPQCRGSLPVRASFCGFCGLRIAADEAATVEPAGEDHRRTDVMAIPLFEEPEPTAPLPVAAAAAARPTLPPASSVAATRVMPRVRRADPLARTEVRPVARRRPRWLVAVLGATLLVATGLAIALAAHSRRGRPDPSLAAATNQAARPPTDDPLADEAASESTAPKPAHHRARAEAPPPPGPPAADAAARQPGSPPPSPAAPVQAPRATTAAEPPLTVRVGSAADGVRFVVHEHRRDVEACYDEAAAQGAPALGGEVVVNFLIGSEGKAAFFRVVANTTARPPLELCLGQLIGRWTFPYATSGELGVTHTFKFAPRPPPP